jgi:hypothetical protein
MHFVSQVTLPPSDASRLTVRGFFNSLLEVRRHATPRILDSFRWAFSGGEDEKRSSVDGLCGVHDCRRGVTLLG